MSNIDRRKLMVGGAVGAAAAVLAGPALAIVEGDAELRKLWADYLSVLTTIEAAGAAHEPFRAAYEKEWEELADHVIRHRDGNLGKLHDLLWKKHGLEPTWRALNRERDNRQCIVTEIRRTKAESLFGIGVKHMGADRVELEQAIDDARRNIADLIGEEFIAVAEIAPVA